MVISVITVSNRGACGHVAAGTWCLSLRGVNRTIVVWADFYISMRGVAPTLSEMTKACALYASVPQETQRI